MLSTDIFLLVSVSHHPKPHTLGTRQDIRDMRRATSSSNLGKLFQSGRLTTQSVPSPSALVSATHLLCHFTNSELKEKESEKIIRT